MARFRLTRYGRREWLAATAAAAAGVVALAVMAWRMSWLCAVPIAPILAVWAWVLWFFRDGDRDIPDEPGAFVSPADGTVADITPVGPDSPLGADGLQIGVFMDIFSVHVNRAPCDGRVESVEHHDGAFLDVRKAEAFTRNESATIRLAYRHAEKDYRVVVRQVAGLIARRIVTDLARGQTVRRGQRIGMIKFGSRLELLVPRELAAEVRVAIGSKTVAGQTVLVAARKESGHANASGS